MKFFLNTLCPKCRPGAEKWFKAQPHNLRLIELQETLIKDICQAKHGKANHANNARHTYR